MEGEKELRGMYKKEMVGEKEMSDGEKEEEKEQ